MTRERRSNEERSRTSRALLIGAARRLFEQQGYAATSIEQIARAADLTKGAVYHHFPTKQALFEAVVVDIQDELADHVDASARKEVTAWQRFVAGWLSALDVAPEAAIRRLMVEGPTVLGYQRWQRIDDEHFLPGVTASLEHLHRQGELSLEPTPTLARVLLTISNALLTFLTQHDDPAAARAEVIPIWEQLLGGLRPAGADGG